MPSLLSSTSPPIDYHNSGPDSVAGSSVIIFLATVAVALRFWARKLTKVPFGLDDYLVLAALIFHHAVAAAGISAVFDGGLGRDYRLVQAEGPETTVFLFKALYASWILYGLSSPLVKLAVLAFLWRIFPTPTVKIGCIILSSLSIAWAISVQIMSFLQCRPLRAFWDRELQTLPETQCLDFVLCYLGTAIANSFIDLATLALPIQEILKLRISRPKKIGVCGIFLLGGITFLASLVRATSFAIILRQGITNLTKQFLLPGFASVLEIYVGIIGACLPVLVPVYRKLRYGNVSKSRTHTLGKRPLWVGTSDAVLNKNKFRAGQGSSERLHVNDEDVTTLVPLTSDRQVGVRSWVGQGPESANNMNIPLRGIVVKQDIEWSTKGRDRLDV
ncbi:hypothetical protein HD806DRAFT_475858 [Xylariaceae sp. AK1471]|nr:hypothetical protein HD806DRAFT_475858 [Xylariaceae sp. AK1471]